MDTPAPTTFDPFHRTALAAAEQQMRIVLLGSGNMTLDQVNRWAPDLARTVVGAYLAELHRVPPPPTPSFRFQGDHRAIEDWAESLIAEHSGAEPRMAAFSGDCYGMYLQPDRLAELGVRAAEPSRVVHVSPGELVVFEDGAFRGITNHDPSECPGCRFAHEWA